MKKDQSVFRRGQVWYINDNRRNIGSIQGKSRPYLVVSNDKCNENSPAIHMAPITTQEKNSQPTHVSFYDTHTRSIQTILVEQTMPKSTPDIAPIAEYKFTLTEQKMNEVDKALAVQFAIPYGGLSLDDFKEILDKMKEDKLAEIQEEISKIYASQQLASVVASDESEEEPDNPELVLAPAEAREEPKPTSHKSTPMSQIDKFNQRLLKADPNRLPHRNLTPSPSEPQVEVSPKGKRNRWTEELKEQFVHDAETLTLDQICEKYSITHTTYYTQLSKFRKELGVSPRSTASSNLRVNGDIDPVEYLKDYDSKPISDIVVEYQLENKKAAVELASTCRNLLGGG